MSEEQGDDARYELVAGVPVRLMAPTNIRHARIQRSVSAALGGAIAAARLPCELFDAGPGVALDANGDECRVPYVVVTCASAIDETARLVPEPVIMVEVASPSTRLADVNEKLEFYGSISSIQHYLVIEQDRRRSFVMAAGRAAGWSLGSCEMARSRSTRPASGSLWTLCIARQSSPAANVS